MSDLVSRRAAVDIVRFECGEWEGLAKTIIKRFEQLPSAQPEPHEKRTETHASDCISRQMLLEYIHGEPVGRLLCDKYNLDGLIEQFPSAQPYTDEEIRRIQELEQAQFEKIYELGYQAGRAAHPNWIPLSEKFPQKDEDVLLQFPSNQGVGYYEDGDWMINTGDGIYCIIGYNEEKPIAWLPLPEPYREDEQE